MYMLCYFDIYHAGVFKIIVKVYYHILFNDLKKTTNILCINPCRCPVHISSAITIFCANLLNFPPTAPLYLCLRVFLTCVT